MEERGGRNLYGFVGNAPERWNDPFGLTWHTEEQRVSMVDQFLDYNAYMIPFWDHPIVDFKVVADIKSEDRASPHCAIQWVGVQGEKWHVSKGRAIDIPLDAVTISIENGYNLYVGHKLSIEWNPGGTKHRFVVDWIAELVRTTGGGVTVTIPVKVTWIPVKKLVEQGVDAGFSGSTMSTRDSESGKFVTEWCCKE